MMHCRNLEVGFSKQAVAALRSNCYLWPLLIPTLRISSRFVQSSVSTLGFEETDLT